MKKTFKWLNIAQFTGAFNDNAFKMTAAIALVGILGKGSLPTVLAICSILFVVPFLLFSNYAGTLADRFSKRDIIVATKWMEIGILALAIPTLLSRLAWPLYLLLFLLCTQSALFGPAKRGIVPELVKEDELSKANGFLTAATYSAAILGTAMPSLLIGYAHLHPLYAVGCSFLLALVGTFAARRIAHVPAFGTRTKSSPWIIPDVARALKNLKDDPWSRRAIWGLVLLGGIMAFFQQALIYFGQDALHLSIEKSPMLFPLAAIGIGIGALLTGHFSKHTIEVGLIPVGAISVVIGSLGLSLAAAPFWVEFWIVGIGASCGMYLVPINAFLQQRIPKERRGEVFGASSFLSFSAMILASSLFYLLTKKAGLSARSCIFTIALITLLPATIACLRLPNHLVRFWLMRLIRRLYKIRFQGLENLPREGGALLICNHTAYADALILQAATQRPVRFLVSRDVFKSWKWCKPLFKLTDCIPIHTSDGPRALVNSLKEARAAMEAGAIVAIFPEGELTKTGSLMKFNKGFEKIARNSGCPIIPAHIDNLWGSIFSYRHGTPRLRLPFKFHYPVSVQFGKPLPSSTTAEEAQRVIAELGAEHATAQSLCPKNTLSHRFLKQARHNWFRPIASDTLGQKTTYGQLLTGSLLLARQLPSDERIGILLPTSIGCVLANLAATLSGKTAVNLNWTASAAALQSAVEQSGLKQVVTSRRFLQKQTLPELSVQWIYLEELLEKPARFRALCSALFASPKRLAGGRTPQPTDTAAIIFSSGTTGTPKGIMLSHANLLSNLDAVQSITQFGKNDSICAILPLFHSFGYLALLWWPLLKGMRVAYHPNPLQTKRVVRLIREEKLTGLLATPPFCKTICAKPLPKIFKLWEPSLLAAKNFQLNSPPTLKKPFPSVPSKATAALNSPPSPCSAMVSHCPISPSASSIPKPAHPYPTEKTAFYS